TGEYRNKCAQGIDPRPKKIVEGQQQSSATSTSPLYKDVVAQFIEYYAKPRQRSWESTQRYLLNYCKDWHDRQIRSITKAEARALLRGMISEDGKGGPNADVTRSWLRTLWRWATAEDLVDAPIMDFVKVEYEKRSKNYWKGQELDEKIGAIWRASETLDKVEETAFIKILLLTAPRKTALALLEWLQLSD